jgi:ribosomal-protein-serine acetyltransferase
MFRASLRPGVELRLLEERHAATVFALVERNRKYLREWMPWVDTTVTEDDTLSFIRASLEQFAGNYGFAAGIWMGDGNPETLAGVIGTHKINWLNRKVELGYWVGQEFQGRGIVTEACRAAVTHLLCEMDLNRVEIHCATGNAKSCAIARRLGFTLEGTLREAELCNGRYLDLNVFAMLQRDWRA